MILILMGKTASGKDIIAKELVSNYKFGKIITYTTRPPRPNEKDGVDYYFISQSDFQKKIKADFFVEWKVYQSAFGDWYYGTAFEDLKQDSVLILTPTGVKDFAKNTKCMFRTVLIDVPKEVRLQRLMERGDKYVEALRRLEHDEKDFENPFVRQLTDLKIQNVNCSVESIAQEISNYWNGEKETIYGVKNMLFSGRNDQ